MNETKLKTLCDSILMAMLGSKELVEKWWVSNNKAFDTTPNEQWTKDPDTVYIYLMQCAEGMW